MSLLHKDKPTEYIVSSRGKFCAYEVTDELIRCNDCKYKRGFHSDGRDVLVCEHGRGLFHIESDSYCSYAERKDDSE